MPLIAVATNDSTVLANIQRALVHADFTTVDASAGMELLRLVFELRPEGVILDMNLPDVDGEELLRILRAASDVPILVLTPTPDAELSAQALDLGADDVAHQGTPTVELVARLRAALRRSARPVAGEPESLLIRTGAIEIDRASKEVRKHGTPVPLTRTEYRLLDALAARTGQMAPHRFLLSAVWGDAYTDDTHYLRVYIGYLRAKLEDDPRRPRYLVNEWGMGYRLAQLPLEEAEGEEVADIEALEEEDETADARAGNASGRNQGESRA